MLTIRYTTPAEVRHIVAVAVVASKVTGERHYVGSEQHTSQVAVEYVTSHGCTGKTTFTTGKVEVFDHGNLMNAYILGAAD